MFLYGLSQKLKRWWERKGSE